MKQCGTAKRIVREPDRTFFIWIPVCYCESTGKYHRILPDFLIKFVHYTVYVISASLDDDPELIDNISPCRKTRKRWFCRFTCDSASGLLSHIMKSASHLLMLLWPVTLFK